MLNGTISIRPLHGKQIKIAAFKLEVISNWKQRKAYQVARKNKKLVKIHCGFINTVGGTGGKCGTCWRSHSVEMSSRRLFKILCNQILPQQETYSNCSFQIQSSCKTFKTQEEVSGIIGLLFFS